MIKLIQGDCLEVMDNIIKEGIKVDAIITDPPYGTTACKWDSVIPFDEMWNRLNKLIKPNGAIVLFGSEPFSSALRMSNIKNYKYDWVWEKDNGTNFASTKYQPFRVHEIISIFGNFPITYTPKQIKCYNPQMTQGKSYTVISGSQTNDSAIIREGSRENMGNYKTKNSGNRYPRSVQKFNRDKGKVHPTQKPVALMEYLIKTYTNENETVLDFTMGSGSTGVACKNTNREFIGIELDDNYFNIAKNRIESNLL